MISARKIVVTKLPEDILEIIERGNIIVARMTNNAYFTTPTPTLAVFQTDLDTLNQTEIDLRSGTGSLDARNTALATVKLDINRLANYVQSIADADIPRAGDIIDSAGFYVKEIGGRSGQVYKVTSEETGIVILSAPANYSVYPYVWEISTDEKVWSVLRTSRFSSCEVKTLTSGQLYYFRYSIVGKDNEYSPYSESTSCRVK